MREDLQTMRVRHRLLYRRQAESSAGPRRPRPGRLSQGPSPSIPSPTETTLGRPSQSDTLSTVDQTDSGGISDIHSGAQFASSDGSLYSTW